MCIQRLLLFVSTGFFPFFKGIEGREDLVAVEKLQARQEHHKDVGLE